MFCQQCGTQIEDGLAFCTNCGAKQIEAKSTQDVNQTSGNAQAQTGGNNQPPQQRMSQQQYQETVQFNPNTGTNTSESPKNVSFGEAIKLFFVNYVNFTGRSTRSEYWWSFLFQCIVSVLTVWIPGIGSIVSLGLLLPGLAINVRRLHDTGRPWTYLLFGLIPLAGFIILIVLYCEESGPDNKWGAAAKN